MKCLLAINPLVICAIWFGITKKAKMNWISENSENYLCDPDEFALQ